MRYKSTLANASGAGKYIPFPVVLSFPLAKNMFCLLHLLTFILQPCYNHLLVSRDFKVNSFIFPTCIIMSSWTKTFLLLPSKYVYFYFLSYLIALASTPSMMFKTRIWIPKFSLLMEEELFLQSWKIDLYLYINHNIFMWERCFISECWFFIKILTPYFHDHNGN